MSMQSLVVGPDSMPDWQEFDYAQPPQRAEQLPAPPPADGYQGLCEALLSNLQELSRYHEGFRCTATQHQIFEAMKFTEEIKKRSNSEMDKLIAAYKRREYVEPEPSPPPQEDTLGTPMDCEVAPTNQQQLWIAPPHVEYSAVQVVTENADSVKTTVAGYQEESEPSTVTDNIAAELAASLYAQAPTACQLPVVAAPVQQVAAPAPAPAAHFHPPSSCTAIVPQDGTNIQEFRNSVQFTAAYFGMKEGDKLFDVLMRKFRDYILPMDAMDAPGWYKATNPVVFKNLKKKFKTFFQKIVLEKLGKDGNFLKKKGKPNKVKEWHYYWSKVQVGGPNIVFSANGGHYCVEVETETQTTFLDEQDPNNKQWVVQPNENLPTASPSIVVKPDTLLDWFVGWVESSSFRKYAEREKKRKEPPTDPTSYTSCAHSGPMPQTAAAYPQVFYMNTGHFFPSVQSGGVPP